MARELSSYKLGEICDFQNGFAFKSTDYVESNDDTYEVFRMGYIARGGGYKEDDNRVFVPRQYARSLDRFLLKAGDIAIAMTDMKSSMALLGHTAAVPIGDRFVLNQRVGRITVKRTDIADQRFLYYYSNQPEHVAYLRSRANSGVQVNLSTDAIREAEILLPSLSKQRAIAHILRTLDDKIESNRRMNETLEEIGGSLFKSWFVDFDLRAKTAGGAPDPYENTTQLFPKGLQESEIGTIPQGWSVRAVYDTATFINGVAFRSVHFSANGSGLPIVKIAELKDGITQQTKFTNDELPEKYSIRDGEILFSWSGSPDTSIDTFVWAGGDGWLNQHIFKVVFNRPEEKHFVYYLLKYLKPTFIEIARNKQTTGLGHVTAEDMKRLKVASPPDPVLKAFQEIVEPIFERSFETLIEARTLTALRDTLLPKLMSGEIRIDLNSCYRNFNECSK